MLPKSQRLNLKQYFPLISKKGHRVETPSLKISYLSGENTHPLIGVALQTKVFRKAVERSSVKRIVYAAVARLYPRLKSNLNLVIMPKSGVLDTNLEQVVTELEKVTDLYEKA